MEDGQKLAAEPTAKALYGVARCIVQNAYPNKKARHTPHRVRRAAMDFAKWSLDVCVGPQLGIEARMTQLAQGDFLNLAHAFAGQFEADPDLVERQ